ncbi:MAG: type II toxin-antitoxin system VapC family toxin [Acidobacteriaceae bacterium]
MLDTDICSYLMRGRSRRIEERLADLAPDEICISVMTRAELLYGLKRLPPSHRLHISVRRFLRMVRVLPWESDAADFYAEIAHQLIRSGQPIGEFDMMIASHALAVGAVLVTNNVRHYDRIEQPLTLENWSE